MQNKPTDIKMDQTKFNKAFNKNDRIIAEEEAKRSRNKTNKNNQHESHNKKDKKKSQSQHKKLSHNYEDDDMDPFEPRKYTEDLGINIKNLFFDILEMIANRENPMPYVMDNPKKQFVFAIMIISIGTLLLFFSNLMI